MALGTCRGVVHHPSSGPSVIPPLADQPKPLSAQPPAMSARIALSSVGTTNYERVMGHAPHVLAPWATLEETFFRHSVLPAELLEQVRRTLALGHGCEYCQAKGGLPERTRPALKTSLAVAFAEAFATDHKAIEASQIQVLSEHFTVAELVELVAFVSFMWAGGTFGKVLGIQPSRTQLSSDDPPSTAGTGAA